MTAACQPTIRRADYASLISKQGAIKSAGALLNNPSDTTVLTLARRDDLSGTQASSNIFFADNSCGNNHLPAVGTALPKVIAGVLGGELDIISSTDSTANLVVQSLITTDAVRSSLLSQTGYTIGVISLNAGEGSTPTGYTGTDTWKFVKIDGVSPTVLADGSVPSSQRTFLNGNYPFAMTSFAVVPTKAPTKGVATLFPSVLSTMIGGLSDSSLHDLKGIGYLDNAPAAKRSLVQRTGGNNCSPLIKFR